MSSISGFRPIVNRLHPRIIRGLGHQSASRGSVAQSVKRIPDKDEVGGSNPPRPTNRTLRPSTDRVSLVSHRANPIMGP